MGQCTFFKFGKKYRLMIHSWHQTTKIFVVCEFFYFFFLRFCKIHLGTVEMLAAALAPEQLVLLFKCDVLAIALLRIENSTSFLSLPQDLDKTQNFDKQVNSNVNKEFLPKKSSPEFWSNSNKNIIKNSVVI